MDAALETLFLKLRNFPDSFWQDKTLAFLGARYHPSFNLFDRSRLFLQQHFKPYAELLQDGGYCVHSLLSEPAEMFDAVFILLPKNISEARFVVAQGLSFLRPGGMVFCAAGNDAGGGRIFKMLQQFGVSDLQQTSKNKAKAVSGVLRDFDRAAVTQTLKDGQMQPVLGGRFVSLPGLFSWDRVDRGSDLLVSYLPSVLTGRCADFGCGYGFLAQHALGRCSGVTEMVCIDADFRALQACRKNLDNFSGVQKRFLWEDLSTGVSPVSDQDVVIMNPPFHEGKKMDADVGRGFILSAADALRAGGMLYMVANRQLPYENLLQEKFSEYSKLYEGEGYKIYAARR
ncbi:MAG: class I SAM-dependent methyltransferase [Rhodospirillales bacterium]|nr:class I SAM-dependent methyltransferase [Alphaproteobacteria bacterium]MCB1840039.1 class I SAM-dependent methyltransferase [Alphaproteobacteria bacterium]MCB9977067.1 class I SAM-dependent methyltransferase [Rhodospirillales bacterium]